MLKTHLFDRSFNVFALVKLQYGKLINNYNNNNTFELASECDATTLRDNTSPATDDIDQLKACALQLALAADRDTSRYTSPLPHRRPMDHFDGRAGAPRRALATDQSPSAPLHRRKVRNCRCRRPKNGSAYSTLMPSSARL